MGKSVKGIIAAAKQDESERLDLGRKSLKAAPDELFVSRIPTPTRSRRPIRRPTRRSTISANPLPFAPPAHLGKAFLRGWSWGGGFGGRGRGVRVRAVRVGEPGSETCGTFSEIPDAVANLRNLSSINLSDNKLTALPATLNQISKLKVLIAKCVSDKPSPCITSLFPTRVALTGELLARHPLTTFPRQPAPGR
ncbi:MAG: hypothetical protein BJ554DRAFT_4423, partial [Olpidium bornovanus]